jgi:hypothetical protein
VIQQSDITGRLRLFRYGLIVVVVVTFLVSLLAPYAVLRGVGYNVSDFLGNALLFTVVVAIIMAVIYYVYRQYLMNNAPRA